MKSWYLLRIKPKQDKRAVFHLEDQNYRCFAPEIMIAKSAKNPKKLTCEPLFPGYIFIQINPENTNWRAISSTRGVLCPVSFGGYPTTVPTQLMDELFECVPNLEEKAISSKTWCTGDKVCITEGCFMHLNAIYYCKSGTERSIILVNLMGKSTKVSVNNNTIEKYNG